jgi:hypothetical protein
MLGAGDRGGGCTDTSPGRQSATIMANPKDDEPRTAPAAEDRKRSGRAGLDDRGNSVWEWQLETGVYSRDITTQRLRKLDLGDLSIAETAKHPQPLGLEEKSGKSERSPGGGFNPYDSGGAENTGGNPYDNARNTARKTQAPAPGVPPSRKPMDLKRLEEWLAIKKRIELQQKDDDEE